MLIVVLLAAVLALVPTAAVADVQPRVVGGTPAARSDAPWIAALVSSGEPASDGQFCGGAVIAPQVVVTAAHCVAESSPARIEVVVGRTSLRASGGDRIPVQSIVVHPSYDLDGVGIDAALLQLAHATAVPAVPLVGGSDATLARANASATVFGWGMTSNVAGSASDELLRGTLGILSGSVCQDVYGARVFASATMICAAGRSAGSPDACRGDSGGPLVASGRLIGLVSFGGERCADPQVPGVYTRVAAAADWIRTTADTLGASSGADEQPVDGSSPELALRVTRIECGRSCRIEVRVSGIDSDAASRVDVRVRQLGSGVDDVVAARHVGLDRWRVQVPLLPLGRVRIVAAARSDDGSVIGARAKVTALVAS